MPSSPNKLRSDRDVNSRSINLLGDWVYRELALLERKILQVQSSVASIVSGISLGNTTIRSGEQSVTSGSNTIAFTANMTSTNYALACKIKGSDNSNIGYNEVSKTTSGFTITVDADGTLTYSAIEFL